MATLTLTQQWLETWCFKLVYFIFYMQIVFFNASHMFRLLAKHKIMY